MSVPANVSKVLFLVAATFAATSALGAQAAASAKAVLELHPGAAAGESVVVLRITSAGRPLASYQGLITFSTEKVEIVSADVPTDAYRVVNKDDAPTGKLRFAGFATDGFHADTALKIRVRSRASGAALTVKLDVAGDVVGKPFPPASLGSATIRIPNRPAKP